MKRSILLMLVALALTRALEVRTQEPLRVLAPVTDALEIAVLDDKPLLDHARTHFSPQIDELVGRSFANLSCSVELVTGNDVHRSEARVSSLICA